MRVYLSHGSMARPVCSYASSIGTWANSQNHRRVARPPRAQECKGRARERLTVLPSSQVGGSAGAGGLGSNPSALQMSSYSCCVAPSWGLATLTKVPVSLGLSMTASSRFLRAIATACYCPLGPGKERAREDGRDPAHPLWLFPCPDPMGNSRQ